MNLINIADRSVLLLLVLMTLGCGSEPRVVEAEISPVLSDEEARLALQDVITTGDASGDEITRLSEQIASQPDRDHQKEIANMLGQMIVMNDPDTNRDLAKQILELW